VQHYRYMHPTRREFLAATGLELLLPWRWFRREPSIAGIRFREVRRDEGRHYIWIHGNEATANGVLSQWMKTATGRAFFVRSNERNVDIEGGKIDPNRMWSRVGAERNLRSLNRGWTDVQIARALNRLDKDREGFLRRVLPATSNLLVALHNNGPGYSVQDEVSISDSVALNDAGHPDEFMLCTSRPDFELLAGGPFNVLLQYRAPQTDDGSLSRLCASRSLRYVNIEAAHENAVGQRRMLEWVNRILT
jgi:hypothetical protein